MELSITKQQTSELSSAEVELEALRAKFEEATSQKSRYLEVMSSQQREIDRLHGK